MRKVALGAHGLVKRLLRQQRLRFAPEQWKFVLVSWMLSLMAGFVRITFGLGSTPQDIDHLCRAWNRLMSEKMSKGRQWLTHRNRGVPATLAVHEAAGKETNGSSPGKWFPTGTGVAHPREKDDA